MSTAGPTTPASAVRSQQLNALLVYPWTAAPLDVETLLRQRAPRGWKLYRALSDEDAEGMARRHLYDLAMIFCRSAEGEPPMLRKLRTRSPRTALIAVLADEDHSMAEELLAQGADTYLFADQLKTGRLKQAADLALNNARIRVENDAVIRQLQRANEEQEYLVRALSHDMSANFMLLESSFGQVRRRLETADDDGSATALAHCEACLEQSRRFVDDLVQLARTGNIDMEPEPVDTDSVVDEVLFEQREWIDQRGAKILVQRPLIDLWCNRRRLKQIVTNLVRNALKHGCDADEPRIEIQTRPGRTPSGGGGTPVAVLRVADNGRGIAREHHDAVFLPGRRVPGTSQSGNGMGLAIVRKVAEYYSGSARLDPERSRGTAVEVVLPIGQPDDGQWWGADQSHGGPLSAGSPGGSHSQPGIHGDSHRPQPHGPF